MPNPVFTVETHARAAQADLIRILGDKDKRIKELEREREVSAREAVAGWMIANSYATGHGDTLEGLLIELVRQARWA